MKKSNETIEILQDDNLKEFIRLHDDICECNLCNSIPQIIKKIRVDKYKIPETKYKIYCQNCQVGTGFSNFSNAAIENWNKKMRPSRFKDCFGFAFTPTDEDGEIVASDYNIRFKIEQFDIIQGKGNGTFLYYLYGEEEKKLALNNFSDNVAIYSNSGLTGNDGVPDIKVCVCISHNIEEAKKMLNSGLKKYFDEIRIKIIEDRNQIEKWLAKNNQKLKNFDNYMKEKENN